MEMLGEYFELGHDQLLPPTLEIHCSVILSELPTVSVYKPQVVSKVEEFS
jgi:hypothetical protein